MNPNQYFRDLSRELKSVQDRIRSFIGDVHWPSDGAWKESVLRTILRRYLPPSYTVGSGFILTADRVSTQIDIIVCDDSAPILFRDGDFMIATPDCVRAVVEVKTRLTATGLRDALVKLNDVSSLLRNRCVHPRPFIGLFAYEAMQSPPASVLQTLKETNGNTNAYEIRALCFGDSQFYRFWEFAPEATPRQTYDSWHAYELKEIAPGYFIHNLLEHLFPHAFERAQHMWYPVDGKENTLVGTMQRREAQPVVHDAVTTTPPPP